MNVSKPFIWWIFVFLGSYTLLSTFGAVPNELVDLNQRLLRAAVLPFTDARQATSTQSTVVGTNQEDQVASAVKELILPDRIVIEKIGVNSRVVNPESRDIQVLDQALLNGVVRYPGSGGLDDKSNMFLFGHSTTFHTVQNQAFRAFNRLGELQIGDIILVRSADTNYVYRVFSVLQADKDQALVEFQDGDEKQLTLSTCDSFGKRSDRFVVRARFIQTLPANTI